MLIVDFTGKSARLSKNVVVAASKAEVVSEAPPASVNQYNQHLTKAGCEWSFFVRYIQVKGRQSNDIQAERLYSPAIGKQPGARCGITN